jgi:hypothetical protein
VKCDQDHKHVRRVMYNGHRSSDTLLVSSAVTKRQGVRVEVLDSDHGKRDAALQGEAHFRKGTENDEPNE